MVTFASRLSPHENTVLPALAVAKSKSVLGLLPTPAEGGLGGILEKIGCPGGEVGRRIERGVLGSILGARR